MEEQTYENLEVDSTVPEWLPFPKQNNEMSLVKEISISERQI